MKFHPTIGELCANVDAVLLESVDGRPHLAQVKPVLNARKPVFIDKPMAGSLHDVIEIFALMEAADQSKRGGGVAVRLEDVLSRARRAGAGALGRRGLKR
jgi:predicted dehydrogenase